MRSRMRLIVHPMNGGSLRVLLGAACLLAVACGGDSGVPTAPSPGTASSISVTYPADHGTIYIGDQVQFQATVSSTGSGTQAATNATWESDAPAVATVSSSDLLTGVSAGEATISAQVPAGGRGSLRIRVFPEFHAHWEGDLNVTSITVPPDWRELGEEDCNGLPDCAFWIPLAADFTQDGAMVTGTVKSTFTAPPNYEWTIQSGTVSIDGTLSLTFDEMAFRLPDERVEIQARLTSWESRADTPGVMTGTATVQYFLRRAVGQRCPGRVSRGRQHHSGVLRVAVAAWRWGIRSFQFAPRLSASARVWRDDPRRRERPRAHVGAGSPLTFARTTDAAAERPDVG